MKRVRSWIGGAASIMLAACGGSGGGSSPNPPPPPPPPPPPTTAQLNATVLDTFGRAVAAAAITTGSTSANTDAAGRASIRGSALMSSLVAVQRGQMPPRDVAQVLRDCVDALKLTIDSLEPGGDDLVVLLATLRYRLEPRLQAAGLALQWDVGDVPKLTWMNATSALQILRILQEVLTNVLKHAQARAIRIATELADDSVAVIVGDDGVGFDAQGSYQGRGLKNLARRAAEIGGEIAIASSPGGTIVRLELPIAGTMPMRDR